MDQPCHSRSEVRSIRRAICATRRLLRRSVNQGGQTPCHSAWRGTYPGRLRRERRGVLRETAVARYRVPFPQATRAWLRHAQRPGAELWAPPGRAVERKLSNACPRITATRLDPDSVASDSVGRFSDRFGIKT